MITLAAEFEGMQSRADKSWKLIFGTQELTPEEIGKIGGAQNNVCFLAINPNPFSSEQEKVINDTKAELADEGKSPSQRLRGVLFVAVMRICTASMAGTSNSSRTAPSPRDMRRWRAGSVKLWASWAPAGSRAKRSRRSNRLNSTPPTKRCSSISRKR